MQLRFLIKSDFFRQSLVDILDSIDGASMRLLVRALIIVVASGLFLSISPLYMAKVIDVMATQELESNKTLFGYVSLSLALRFIGQALVDLRWNIINPVLYTISYSLCTLTASRLSVIFRHEGRTGDSAAAIAEQVSVISKMELGSISLLYGLLVVIIPTAIELLVVSIAVGVMVGFWLLLYMMLGMIVFIIAVSFKRDEELLSATAAHEIDNVVSASFAEYISNPSLVREFDASKFLRYRLEQQIKISILEHQRLFSIKTDRGLCLTAVTCVIYSMVLFGAILSPKTLPISAGGYFLLVIYLDRILQPLTNASAAINNIQNGLISMKGAYGLLQTFEKNAALMPFIKTKKNTWDTILLSPKRCFFHANQVLTIGKSTWIRLLGPSGSGKSTYLRQIYRKLLSDSNRSGTGMHYLNPAPVIIRGSVFDNIALGDTSITKEMVETYWTEWHLGLGNNQIDIDTKAEQLSAGEMQFLAICRTLVRNPKLVIFDEATNSIDIDSEPQIWPMIQKALPEATVFVVSHREVSSIHFDHEEVIAHF
jgi:ABC-type multidrug transport system fused ATPase/permease subunit